MPADGIAGLWADVVKRFTNMGGKSAPYFMPMAGCDTSIFTDDAVRALQHWIVLDNEAKGNCAHQRTQEAFTAWAEEFGRMLR